MCGHFVREIPETTHVKESWSWFWKTDLKIQTEVLICAGKEQALRTIYVKYYMKKMVGTHYIGDVARKVRVSITLFVSVKGWPKGNTNRDMTMLQK